MRIVCQKCSAAYAIDDKFVTPKGVRAQCPRCRHTQLVKREESAAAAAPASDSFEIELAIDIKGHSPAVGMFGKATISPAVNYTGHNIPYEALLEANGDKGFVFVTDDRKTVQRVEVTISAIENNRVLIADGLQGHAFVVISGSPYLTNGTKINITE